MWNNRGFTLIELLTVIAILSILMAIAVPRTTGYIERGALTVDVSNAMIISNHMILFHQIRERWPASETELFGLGGMLTEKPLTQSSSSRFVIGYQGRVQLIYKNQVHWCSNGTKTMIKPVEELPR